MSACAASRVGACVQSCSSFPDTGNLDGCWCFTAGIGVGIQTYCAGTLSGRFIRFTDRIGLAVFALQAALPQPLHAHTELAAFGAAADLAALRFGITHGIWCALSCWVWMLFPMLIPRGHVLTMVLVTILVLSERLDHPARPCWRPRGLGRLTRILIAQAQTRLHARELGSHSSAFET